MGKIRLAVVLVAVIATTAIAAPTAQAQTTTTTNPTYQRASVSFWKAWDCLLGAAAFIAGNTYLVLKIKRFGGIAKFAKELWKAKSTEERAKVIAKAIGYVAGTGALVRACTP